jgi:hypothetical protein
MVSRVNLDLVNGCTQVAHFNSILILTEKAVFGKDFCSPMLTTIQDSSPRSPFKLGSPASVPLTKKPYLMEIPMELETSTARVMRVRLCPKSYLPFRIPSRPKSMYGTGTRWTYIPTASSHLPLDVVLAEGSEAEPFIKSNSEGSIPAEDVECKSKSKVNCFATEWIGHSSKPSMKFLVELAIEQLCINQSPAIIAQNIQKKETTTQDFSLYTKILKNIQVCFPKFSGLTMQTYYDMKGNTRLLVRKS